MEPNAFAERRLEVLDVWVAGNRALGRVQARARGAGNGMPIDLEAWTVWTFDAFGMATRAEIYLGHQGAEARIAAGFVEGAGL